MTIRSASSNPEHPTRTKRRRLRGELQKDPDCTKLNSSLMVEAAGVELFRVLITRNLLIPGSTKRAKKAPLPNPLYVYCTKMLFALDTR